MDDKDIFDLYQTQYYHEIDYREKFNTRMQIPIAVFAAEFSIIAYFLKTSKIVIVDVVAACFFGLALFLGCMAIASAYMLIKAKSGKDISPKYLILFIAFLSLAVLCAHLPAKFTTPHFYHLLGFIITSLLFLIPSFYYFVRASLFYEYKYMPLCDSTEKYYEDLKVYYSDEIDCDNIVLEKMSQYVRGRYIECSSINGSNNESRSFYFHRTYTFMVISFVFIGLAVIPYYLGRVNIESDAVHKIEVTKLTQKGEQQMANEQNSTPKPPPPQPPPARIIKEGVNPKNTNK